MFQDLSQRGVVSALLILTVAVNQPAALAAVRPSQFIDPAPPQVRALADVPPPTARSHDELTFHAAPKPLAPGAVTHDWRSFLGPSHNAISTETPLLKRFGDDGPSMLWQVTKGQGYASAAVVGQRVLMFHRVGNEEIIECLAAETGQRFWKYSYPTSYRDRYNMGDGPRCQPISDGEFVYTFGVEGKLLCLKLATGQLLWQRDILSEFKLTQNHFGVVATPLLEGDLLIINVGAPAGPCVAAFDKRSGKMVWGAGDKWGPSYASPIPATVNGQRRIFIFAGGESRPPSGGLLSIDPADGRIVFRFPWRAPKFESANASSPLIVGNEVFISECYGPGGALLKVLPDGAPRKVWSHKLLNTHFMTPIHKDGYLYGIAGHGPKNAPLVCLELRTGKQMWRTVPRWDSIVQTRQGKRKFDLVPAMASMIQVDGRGLILGEFGHLAWLDLNPKEYRELERVHLFAARNTWSMPALSRGLLYVCQNTKAADGTPPRLICYDLRGE
jgi:outer membrane protein assembly factor BamB